MLCSVDHNGFYYWVGATDQRHEGNWLWGSMEPVEDFVWFESKINKTKIFDDLFFSDQPSNSAKQNCMFWSWEADGAGDDMCSFSIAIFPLCQRL